MHSYPEIFFGLEDVDAFRSLVTIPFRSAIAIYSTGGYETGYNKDLHHCIGTFVVSSPNESIRLVTW
jgi:hypothetical protein